MCVVGVAVVVVEGVSRGLEVTLSLFSLLNSFLSFIFRGVWRKRWGDVGRLLGEKTG